MSVQETDREWREEKLAEDQAWGLYSFDGRDLLAEVEKLCERVARIEDDRAIEADLLSWLVRGISDVLAAFGLVLERLREEHASGFGPQA
jgi:hypothetical protein